MTQLFDALLVGALNWPSSYHYTIFFFSRFSTNLMWRRPANHITCQLLAVDLATNPVWWKTRPLEVEGLKQAKIERNDEEVELKKSMLWEEVRECFVIIVFKNDVCGRLHVGKEWRVQVGLNLGLTKIATAKARVHAEGVQQNYVMALCQTGGVQRERFFFTENSGKGICGFKMQRITVTCLGESNHGRSTWAASCSCSL